MATQPTPMMTVGHCGLDQREAAAWALPRKHGMMVGYKTSTLISNLTGLGSNGGSCRGGVMRAQSERGHTLVAPFGKVCGL